MTTTVFRFDVGYSTNCFIICYSIKFKFMKLLMPEIFIKSITVCGIVSASDVYEESIKIIVKVH